MAELNTRGVRPGRQYRATRLVVDDFGDAVSYEYRCPSCKRWHTIHPGECRECMAWRVHCRRLADPEGVRRAKRERHRRLVERDPEVGRREVERARLNWERRLREDPEKARAEKRARQARYRARVQKDRRRRKRRVELERMGKVLRGETTGERARRVNGTGSDTVRLYVPAAPLLFAIDRAAARCGGTGHIVREAGIGQRLHYAWRSGERRNATWDAADAVLIALDRLWWEVFDLEDTRLHGVFSGVRSRDVVGWVRAAEMAAELWAGED